MFISIFLPVFFDVKRILKYLSESSLNSGSTTFDDPNVISSISVNDEFSKSTELVSNSKCSMFGTILISFLNASYVSFGAFKARSSSDS